MQIAYAEFDLDKVMELYATGLKVAPGDTIIKHEHFIDVNKNKVIFRVYVEKSGEGEAKPLIVLPDSKN